MRQGHLVGLIVLFSLAAVLHAANPPAEHPAKADLIADVTSAQPGQPFQIALRIQMPKDWHIYWIDPGDSGTPTEFTFKGPEGWKIEPLPFPTPHKFTMPGDIVNIGYEGTVLFLAKVTPPPTAKGPAAFSVDAEWLVCNPEMCIPGKGSAKLTLDVGEAASPANVQLFDTWAQQLPQPINIPELPVLATAGDISVTVPVDSPVKSAEAFLAPGKGFAIKNVKVTPRGKTVVVSFNARAIGKDKKPGEMVVLLAYDDTGGVRRSVQFKYPLKP